VQRVSSQDSCPGTLQLHQAADGGLARVRIPGGRLDAAQWRAVVAASSDLGDGNLDLTSRGNLQIRGLSPGSEAALSDCLWRAGLLPSISHERARNIVASPLAGLDGEGVCDVRPLVSDLDQALCATPSLAELSGRFLFALDDGRGDVATLGADICLIGIGPDRLQLLVNGVVSGPELSAGGAARAAITAAEVFLAERAATGSKAWRIAELPRSTSGTLWRPSSHNVPLIGWSPRALVVGIRLGRLTTAQAGLIGTLADQGLIVTPWRTLVLPGASQGVGELLGDAGLIVDPASRWVGVTSCTGRPGCDKALADVRNDALVVHADLLDCPEMPVHWVGCERRCGSPATASVEVLATGAGYRVTGDEGGELSEAVERIT
jgi:precorrin-3B synthase